MVFPRGLLAAPLGILNHPLVPKYNSASWSAQHQMMKIIKSIKFKLYKALKNHNHTWMNVFTTCYVKSQTLVSVSYLGLSWELLSAIYINRPHWILNVVFFMLAAQNSYSSQIHIIQTEVKGQY